MNRNLFKLLPLMAAMILAASCGNNDKDPVTPHPAPSTNATDVIDNGDGTFTVPFTVKVSNGKSLTKKMEYTEGENGKINIEFVVGTNDDAKLRVSGNGVTGELGLKSELDDMTMTQTYFFSGDLTLSDGVTVADLDKGIDLYYEYGTELTESTSSNESLLDLVQHCNHLYKGTAKSNVETITLTDQNTYLDISMSPCCDHTIIVNNKEFTVEKAKGGRLWIAVPSGKAVESASLGINQSADKVKPSEYHKVVRQYFTIANGDKVYFSPGNLQYSPGQNIWQFAPNQYDKLTTNSNSYTSSNNGFIDLFGWGNWLIVENVTTYQLNISDRPMEYSWPFGSQSAIGAEWFTLSNNDWSYILNRTDPSNNSAKLYNSATINGTTGLILLPDGYNTTGINWSDWSTLESSGAVFLPAAGSRLQKQVNGVGSYGNYWTSTSFGNSNAYRWYFDGAGSVTLNDNTQMRHLGFSVRLVRAVK